jgi:hypothetical protein
MKMNRSRVNLIAAAAVTFGLAFAGNAIVHTGAYAQRAPDSYYAGPHVAPRAYASIKGQSDMDIRKQCYAEARQRWGTNSQDMQTPSDFAYRACAFAHGVRNP